MRFLKFILLAMGFFSVELSIHGKGKAPTAKKNWADLRYTDLIRQEYDYSCGPASLATIARYFYGLQITEIDVLQIINTGKPATFSDLSYAAEQLGFKTMAIGANMEHIENLKVPAIVHLNQNGIDHFSVIRGVSSEWIWLADSSWGNRKMKRHEFLSLWKTREDENLYGKMLIILPGTNNATASTGYFKAPAADDFIYDSIHELRFLPPSYGHESLRIIPRK